MGVACGDGLVTVTDNDHIEKSNLSRQFLFRPHHIKHSKSLCARDSVLHINRDMKYAAGCPALHIDPQSVSLSLLMLQG
jgi:molybdopterin/thiamine biosynthesis adenylyltransferase